MWVRRNSEEPGARDSDSSPDCVAGQGPFSLWASAMGGEHILLAAGRGEVQRQLWIEKLSKLSSPTASGRGGFLLIWQSGAWAWLCDLEQRSLLLWPQSSRLHSRNGRGLDPVSQAALPIVPFPPLPMDPLPVPVGCFGCEASVAAPPCPLSPAPPGCPAVFLTLSASLSHHPRLCLFFPVGLSLSPLSSVSLDPRSSHTWFTFRWLHRYFAPSPLPPRSRGPDRAGSSPVPISSSSSSSLWGN